MSLHDYVVALKPKTSAVVLHGGFATEGESQPLVKKGNSLNELRFPASVPTRLPDGRYEAGTYGTGASAVELLDSADVADGMFTSPLRLRARFTWSQENLDRELANGTSIIVNTRRLQPRAIKAEVGMKGFPSYLDGRALQATNEDAFEELADLFGRERVFSTPKPSNLLKTLLQSVSVLEDQAVLDFFAGSGTLAHAAIKASAIDGVRRPFVIVDLGGFFMTVTVPRVMKVAYAAEWEDGRPAGLPDGDEVAAAPRVMKLVSLESYDDALSSVETTDEHVLNGLLDQAVERSPALLNVERLAHPFEYEIKTLTDDGPRTHAADLVETFNLAYGVHVQRIQIWTSEADARPYRAVIGYKDGTRLLILWRDMTGLDPAVERRFLEGRIEAGAYDEVLINGDSAVPAVRSLDPIFKRLIEEEDR